MDSVDRDVWHVNDDFMIDLYLFAEEEEKSQQLQIVE